jgi:hypothetical protein
MPIGTNNDYITTEELNAVLEASRGLKIWGEGEPKPLDRIGFTTFDMAMNAAPKSQVQSIQGGFQFEVKGNRNQRHHWFHGSKKLKFEYHATPFNFKFYVGKGQMGNMTLIDYLERAGIKVKYGTELREGGVPSDKQQVIFNVLKVEKDDIEYAAKMDLARRWFTANTDEADCFYGVETLFPATTNTTGNFGNVARANPLARHQLVTGVTGDNVNLAFAQMERLITDAGGQTKCIVVGDNWFDMLMGLYQGTTTLRGKFDINVGYEQAKEFGSKFRISLPHDSFVGPNGVLVTREPLFRKLDAWENPAVLYANRAYWFDFSSFFTILEKHNEYVNHGMPYDQLVNYSSVFNSLCLASDNPGAQGVMIKN